MIYHAAGASGQGVFQAAKAANKLAIGVDSDQYNVPAYADVKDVIITSMLKRVDVAVFDYVNAVAAGDTSTLPEGVRPDRGRRRLRHLRRQGRRHRRPTSTPTRPQIISGKIKVESTPSS